MVNLYHALYKRFTYPDAPHARSPSDWWHSDKSVCLTNMLQRQALIFTGLVQLPQCDCDITVIIYKITEYAFTAS
jgi:hypothetical protein